MTYQIGSLSEQGWIDDPEITMNFLFTCYMLTDAAQSLVFRGNLTSLPYTYHLFINDPLGMATAMQSDLTTLLGRHFENVDVQANVKEVTGKYHAILLSASAMTSDGRRIDLSRVMQINTNNLRNIIAVNNYGDGKEVLDNL